MAAISDPGSARSFFLLKQPFFSPLSPHIGSLNGWGLYSTIYKVPLEDYSGESAVHKLNKIKLDFYHFKQIRLMGQFIALLCHPLRNLKGQIFRLL